MSINRVEMSGNLTRDPEMFTSQGGTDILKFGVAVNDRRKNPQSGEWEDYANFVDCVAFGKRCDYYNRHLHKGRKVFVEGRLHYSTWERDGQKRSKLEVVVDDVDFDFGASSRKDDEHDNEAPRQQQQPRRQTNATQQGQQQRGHVVAQEDVYNLDDIPF